MLYVVAFGVKPRTSPHTFTRVGAIVHSITWIACEGGRGGLFGKVGLVRILRFDQGDAGPARALHNGPSVLLAVWLLATVEGIGSARGLARCAKSTMLTGGCVDINYHMLSDFRGAHPGALDELLTQIVASLTTAGAVTLERVAQDGMRVRASASASSFRRQETLETHLEAARAQVERLAKEREHPDPGVNQRERAARERAARERVEQALDYLPQAQAAKERQQQTQAIAKRAKVSAPRVSSTDPEARVMKMPDGCFRPAYNVELATDQAQGIIVGVTVIKEGTDAGQALPMEEQVVERTGRHPGLT